MPYTVAVLNYKFSVAHWDEGEVLQKCKYFMTKCGSLNPEMRVPKCKNAGVKRFH